MVGFVAVDPAVTAFHQFDVARDAATVNDGFPTRSVRSKSMAHAVMRCRIFPYEQADGPANMALDEALLDAVAAEPSQALLRTYGWSEPTLSLGYFQKISEAEADPRWHRVPIVRRPTGGGAIWHHHELTYALVIPAGHPLARPAATLYHAVHSALADLLRRHGVDTALRGALTPSPTAPPPFLCFADRAAEDLVCQHAKIVGSAQRRRSGAILQHGSMLLRRSPFRLPSFPGVADLSAANHRCRGTGRSLWRRTLRGAGTRSPALEDVPLRASGSTGSLGSGRSIEITHGIGDDRTIIVSV